jgi:hypothetical protein
MRAWRGDGRREVLRMWHWKSLDIMEVKLSSNIILDKLSI